MTDGARDLPAAAPAGYYGNSLNVEGWREREGDGAVRNLGAMALMVWQLGRQRWHWAVYAPRDNFLRPLAKGEARRMLDAQRAAEAAARFLAGQVMDATDFEAGGHWAAQVRKRRDTTTGQTRYPCNMDPKDRLVVMIDDDGDVSFAVHSGDRLSERVYLSPEDTAVLSADLAARSLEGRRRRDGLGLKRGPAGDSARDAAKEAREAVDIMRAALRRLADTLDDGDASGGP